MARRWEAADTVIAAATALLVIVFAVFAFLCWQGYWNTLRQAETRAQNGASIVADQTAWVLGSGRAVLGQIDRSIGGDPSAFGAEQRAAADAALAALPADGAIAVYDSSGNAVPDGASELMPASLAGTDNFTAVAQGEDWRIFQLPPTASDGNGLFAIIHRLSRDGAFAGAVVLAIEDSIIEAFWSAQNLGPDSTVSVVREDGWVMARYPTIVEPLNLGSLPVFQTLQSSESGVYYSGESPVDGVPRVVGFRHLPELGVITLAGVSEGAVIGALWSAIWTVTLLMLPIALALLIGSMLTARLLRQGERTRQNLAAALANNEVLFREIHHRVKNNLQSVASLLQLQPIPREVKSEMAQRIAAMSAVHEHIYRSNSFSTVEVRDYLQTLIENIRGGHDPRVKVVEQIENLPVDKDSATPLGLILNEVVSNAFKHAFTDGREGVVRVQLRREDDATGVLQVEDNGVGFDPSTPSKGIGRRLIAALTEQLGGRSSFSPATTGSRFTLEFPLAKSAAPAQSGGR